MKKNRKKKGCSPTRTPETMWHRTGRGSHGTPKGEPGYDRKKAGEHARREVMYFFNPEKQSTDVGSGIEIISVPCGYGLNTG